MSCFRQKLLFVNMGPITEPISFTQELETVEVVYEHVNLDPTFGKKPSSKSELEEKVCSMNLACLIFRIITTIMNFIFNLTKILFESAVSCSNQVLCCEVVDVINLFIFITNLQLLFCDKKYL